MQRRKFIAGVGSLAAAGAAGIGTGAFSSMSASRTADVNVVNDSSGLVALKPGPNIDSDVVREDGGELMIDFTASGSAGGVNVNSRYQVGAVGKAGTPPEIDPLGVGNDKGNNPAPGGGKYAAFLVQNLDTTTHDVELTYDSNGDIGGSELYLKAVLGNVDSLELDSLLIDDTTTSGTLDVGDPDNGGEVGPGQYIAVGIHVDARDGDVDDDLSGTLTVSTN